MPFDPEIQENIIDQNNDDFLTDLQNENTTAFNNPPPLMDSDIPDANTAGGEYTETEDATGTTDGKKTDPANDKITETLSELIIIMFDITHNSLMRYVSDEPDGSKFAVSVADKRQLKQSLAKVLESKTMTVSPGMLLFITAVIVYLPATISAFQIRSVKARAQRAADKANAEREARAAASRPSPSGPVTAPAPSMATVENLPVYRNKGGRPPGTTKEVIALREQAAKLAKRKR